MVQLSPPAPETDPLPVPPPEPTVTANEPPPPKRAMTVRATAIDTVQLGLSPLHAPPHPSKLCPAPGAAESTTLLVAAKGALHVPLSVVATIVHVMPVAVTTPDPPPPPLTTVSVFGAEKFTAT